MINKLPNLVKYLLIESESPGIEFDEELEKETNNYELTELLNTINNILIDHDEIQLKYIKSYDKYGFVVWSHENDDTLEATIMSTEDIINLINRYVVKQKYGMQVNDDFLNINQFNTTHDDTDIPKLYDALIKYYVDIFKKNPEDPEEYNTYLDDAENSGIINDIQRKKLVEIYGKNGSKTEIGIEGI